MAIYAIRNNCDKRGIFEQKFVILAAPGVDGYVKPRERGFMPKITV